MTISELLDRRAAELRAENRSYRLRRAAVVMWGLAINLVAGIAIALFLGHLIQKSAGNLAIDLGRAQDVRW